MAQLSVKLDASWLRYLGAEFDQPYMKTLQTYLVEQRKAGKTVLPAADEYFNAFNATAFESVKVVILGQDPYHGPGQAHGLCFSVKKGVKPPPSLKNIYKEIAADLQVDNNFAHGDLTHWANHGVLLLNSVLTVEQNLAASHQGKGWEIFTDRVIEVLSESRQHCVFMLWGSYAQKKGQKIDATKHLVLKSPHPSPLSAYRGFFGAKHFSQCNTYLEHTGQQAIDWANL